MVWGLITGALSAVGSFISGAVSTVGTAIGGFAKKALNLISKIPGGEIAKTVTEVAKKVHSVVDVLGIKSEKEPEVLGAKAVNSEKTLSQFDNKVEDYIAHLKEEVEFDKEKFDSMTSQQKLGCKVIGMTLEVKAVEEKIGGIEITPESIATLTKIQIGGIEMDPKELVRILQVLKENGISNLQDVVDLLKGKGNSDRLKTGEIFVKTLGDNGMERFLELQDAVLKHEEQ